MCLTLFWSSINLIFLFHWRQQDLMICWLERAESVTRDGKTWICDSRLIGHTSNPFCHSSLSVILLYCIYYKVSWYSYKARRWRVMMTMARILLMIMMTTMNTTTTISLVISDEILTFLLTKATRTATLARRPRVTIVPYMKMKQYWANGLILNV